MTLSPIPESQYALEDCIVILEESRQLLLSYRFKKRHYCDLIEKVYDHIEVLANDFWPVAKPSDKIILHEHFRILFKMFLLKPDKKNLSSEHFNFLKLIEHYLMVKTNANQKAIMKNKRNVLLKLPSYLTDRHLPK